MSDIVSTTLLRPISERPTIDISVEPARRWWQWIIDRNPFFLLSGLCMFAGCFLISREIHATDPSEKGFVAMLVGLVVVLNLYEAAVIGLGLVLSRSRSLVRDARHLLGLALLLLVDIAFVYNETATADPRLGGTIAVIAGALAVAKLVVLTHYAGIRLRPVGLGAVSLTLLVLYTMPVAMRLIASNGFITVPAMFGVWGALGLLVACYAVPGQWTVAGETWGRDHQQLQRLIRVLVLSLPLASVLIHALLAFWVYGTEFSIAFAAPVILGGAAIVLRQHARLGGARPAARAATVLVVAALIATLTTPSTLIHVFGGGWPSVSPLRGVLLVGPVLLGWAWCLTGGVAALPIAAAMLTGMVLGHTPAVMWDRSAQFARWCRETFTTILPDGRLGWGVAGVTLAFVLLGVGGWMSWWRHRTDRDRSRASDLLSP